MRKKLMSFKHQNFRGVLKEDKEVQLKLSCICFYTYCCLFGKNFKFQQKKIFLAANNINLKEYQQLCWLCFLISFPRNIC